MFWASNCDAAIVSKLSNCLKYHLILLLRHFEDHQFEFQPFPFLLDGRNPQKPIAGKLDCALLLKSQFHTFVAQKLIRGISEYRLKFPDQALNPWINMCLSVLGQNRLNHYFHF